MCTVFLPPGDNPIAFNKYIILPFVSVRWDFVCINDILLVYSFSLHVVMVVGQI